MLISIEYGRNENGYFRSISVDGLRESEPMNPRNFPLEVQRVLLVPQEGNADALPDELKKEPEPTKNEYRISQQLRDKVTGEVCTLIAYTRIELEESIHKLQVYNPNYELA